MMNADIICLKEVDIIRLIQDYLDFRGFHMTLDALERETGVINAQYPEEAVVLRYLILDGKWKEAVHYIKRLPLQEEDMRFMIFEIMKQKYIELICVYEELGNELYDDLGNAIALCFSEMSSYCSCPVEYENLRKLASLTKLSQDSKYKNWNPFTSRRQCFQTVNLVLLELPGLEIQCTEPLVDSQRLTDLLVKGILYESCEEFCRKKASTHFEAVPFNFSSLVHKPKSIGSNLSLHSWLQSVPRNTMVQNFVNRSITAHVDNINSALPNEKWTERILQNSTDLPADVAKELKPLDIASQELKEKFWNKRIENNLILDAPEILKRVEEVVTRWEKLNFGKPSSSVDSTVSRIPNIGHAAIKGVKTDCDIKNLELSGEDERYLKISATRGVSKSNTGGDYSVEVCEDADWCSGTKPSISKIDCELATGGCFQEQLDKNSEFSVNLSSTKCHSRKKRHQGNQGSTEDKKDIYTESSLHSFNKQALYDEEQNVRDLLAVKEIVREKLLSILKGNGSEDKTEGEDIKPHFYVEVLPQRHGC